MTCARTSSFHPATSAGDVFVDHLVAGDFERLSAMFEPDATLSALLPDRLHEWPGPERITRAFVRWFGTADTCDFLHATVDHVGPRLQMQWAARVSGGPFGDGTFVVVQHVYIDPGPSGRIGNMSMLCSGFVQERADATSAADQRGGAPSQDERSPQLHSLEHLRRPRVEI